MNLSANLKQHASPSPWSPTELLHPFNDASVWRGLLASINPMWALGQVRARVLAVKDESPEVRSLLLQPNRAWRGYRAGQHVVMDVQVNGVRRQRTFSISSAPGRRGDAFTLSIKRHAAGGVTDWIHQHVRVGTVLHLSQAHGEFAAPKQMRANGGLLLLSAGSGITPVISVLRELLQRGHVGPLHFLHICRSPADALFAAELQALSAAHTNLHVQRWISNEQGRFNTAALCQLIPKATEQPTLLCGPTALMQDLAAHYAQSQALDRLVFEDFNGAMRRLSPGDGSIHTVSGPVLHTTFTAPAELALLQAAEAAGLKPAFGCRIGICMTCQCTKVSGTVQNLRTGAISTQPGERIQLCISAARSDLELAP